MKLRESDKERTLKDSAFLCLIPSKEKRKTPEKETPKKLEKTPYMGIEVKSPSQLESPPRSHAQ